MSGTIAVIGASAERTKFGNKCVRAYLEAGWQVFPVNLREESIEGLAVHRTVGEASDAAGGALDRVAIYLPPETTRELLSAVAEVGARDVFFNPGSATPSVLAEAREHDIAVRDACAIVDIGLSPSDFP